MNFFLLIPRGSAQRIVYSSEMRSGTTFLGNFLNTQKDLFVYSDMLVSLVREFEKLNISSIEKKLSDREKNILFSNVIAEGRRNDVLLEELPRSEVASWYQLFDLALNEMSKLKECKLVGVKITRADKMFNGLLKNGYKIIYCVRDPRDVILSAKNRFSHFAYGKFIKRWNQYIHRAFTLRSNPNFYLLKYENLILNPEKECEKLSDFLELNVNQNIQGDLVHGLDSDYINNSSFGDVKKVFDPIAVFRWKDNQDAEDNIRVELYLKDEIKKLNYQATNNRVGLIKRGKFWVQSSSLIYYAKIALQIIR